MECTPEALIALAQCTDKCIPRGYLGAVQISLTCQWVTVGPTPPGLQNYLTDDQGRYILDDQGHRIVIQL